MIERNLTASEVIKQLGVARAKFYSAFKQGKFESLAISPRKNMFSLEEVKSALETRGGAKATSHDESHPQFDELENEDEEILAQAEAEATEACVQAIMDVYLESIQKARKRRNPKLTKRLLQALTAAQSAFDAEEEETEEDTAATRKSRKAPGRGGGSGTHEPPPSTLPFPSRQGCLITPPSASIWAGLFPGPTDFLCEVIQMLIAGLDLETTGLDTKTCGITEISAALWDSDKGKLLSMFSSYVRPQSDAPFTYEQNGITRADCERFGVDLSEALTCAYLQVLRYADAGVAHNWTDFDGLIMKRVWSEQSLYVPTESLCPVLWIDSSVDVPYPEHITTRKLEFLCASHGFLNPFPHRSLFDVISMLQVLSHYSIEKILELANSPMVRIQALVDYENREKAKARGYRWENPAGIWTKNIRSCQLEREQAEAGFIVQVNAP